MLFRDGTRPEPTWCGRGTVAGRMVPKPHTLGTDVVRKGNRRGPHGSHPAHARSRRGAEGEPRFRKWNPAPTLSSPSEQAADEFFGLGYAKGI